MKKLDKIFILTIGLVLALTSCQKEKAVPSPEVCFTINNSSGAEISETIVGQEVTFKFCSSKSDYQSIWLGDSLVNSSNVTTERHNYDGLGKIYPGAKTTFPKGFSVSKSATTNLYSEYKYTYKLPGTYTVTVIGTYAGKDAEEIKSAKLEKKITVK